MSSYFKANLRLYNTFTSAPEDEVNSNETFIKDSGYTLNNSMFYCSQVRDIFQGNLIMPILVSHATCQALAMGASTRGNIPRLR